jgi:hypothetical protein
VPQIGHTFAAAQSGQHEAQQAVHFWSAVVNGQLGSPQMSQTWAESQHTLQLSAACASAGVARANFPAQRLPAPTKAAKTSNAYSPRNIKNLPCEAGDRLQGNIPRDGA